MDIEQLIAERAIYRQLVRFARAMDSRDWDEIRAITTAQTRADLGTGEIVGSDAIINLIRSYLDNCGTTQHLLGNVIIEVEGDHATSESYVADLHLGRLEQEQLQFRTLGNYSDSWIKREGTWYLAARRKDNRAIVGTLAVFE